VLAIPWRVTKIELDPSLNGQPSELAGNKFGRLPQWERKEC